MSSENTSNESELIGVLAIQGDFAKHQEALDAIGARSKEVRTTEDLAEVDRLIIPGGESTTVGLLLQRFGLGEAIQIAAEKGMPIWGTCMGMIMMAKEVESRPNQYTLDLLDIRIVRNAFGAQVHSFEESVQFDPLHEPVLGVFIRAPIVSSCGKDVEVLSRYQDSVVAVRQGRRLGTSFHPELTDDTRVHRYFLSL
jgi:5'-phosphate synthase pdxT subunit